MKQWGMLLLGCLLSMGQSGFAAPALGGETGTLAVPSADVLRPGNMHLSWSSIQDGHRTGLAIGISPRLEAGVQRCNLSEEHQGRTEFGMKYQLQPEGIFQPGIAAGIEDIGREHCRSFYGVGSKTLPYGVRLHGGIGNGRYAGGFAAVEVRAFPAKPAGVFPDLTVFAEHADGHGVYGMRLALSRGWMVEAGVDGSKHFAGISYNYY